MRHDYPDLVDLAHGAKSQWYDENGVPRYRPFEPELCPNIYADIRVLMLVRCQNCHQQFAVQMSADAFDSGLRNQPIRNWHYGDPPAHGCVGDTMNCEDVAILEVWWRGYPLHEWQRRRDEEGIIDDPWAEGRFTEPEGESKVT